MRITEDTVWKSLTIPFLPDVEGDEDDVHKGFRNVVAFAKAMPIPDMSDAEKLEALRLMFELGYCQTIEDDSGNLALEIMYPEPAE